MKTTFKDGKEGVLMILLLNGSQICTLEYYLDLDTQDAYMRIPELSDKFFKVNLQETMQAQETEDMLRCYIKELCMEPDRIHMQLFLQCHASVKSICGDHIHRLKRRMISLLSLMSIEE